MQLFDSNNPGERKKAIVAAVLAIVAIAVLGYVFFGSSGTPKKPQSAKTGATPQPPSQARGPIEAPVSYDPGIYRPVVPPGSALAFVEPNRNIFAYYEPPPPTPIPVRIPSPPPTPTPPLTLNSLMPAQVYARTADFTLQAMGDKFTSAVRITVDGRELPTRFISAQQVAATVPAALIATPGTREVAVRSSDGQLYSLPLTLNLAPPWDVDNGRILESVIQIRNRRILLLDCHTMTRAHVVKMLLDNHASHHSSCANEPAAQQLARGIHLRIEQICLNQPSDVEETALKSSTGSGQNVDRSVMSHRHRGQIVEWLFRRVPIRPNAYAQ